MLSLPRPVPDIRTQAALEPVYQHLFGRELRRLGIEDDFHPVGGAANYSLLYLLLRIAEEMRPASVLDVGAGQSSRLWDRLRGVGLVGSVLTLEDDASWGERIGAQVSHPVLVTPLRRAGVEGVSVDTYDWDAVRARGPFELVLIDGPRGVPRHSRRGVLSLLTPETPADFALVMDDASRFGERQTVGAVHRRLAQLGRPYQAGVTSAADAQIVFGLGRFAPAAFF